MSHVQEHDDLQQGRLHALRAAGSRQAGLIAVVVAAALWGLGGTLAGELFSQGADPLEVVAVRTWVALTGLGVLALSRRQPSVPARPVPWRFVVGFGLSVSVANAGLFLAIGRLPVAVALVLQNLAPAFVIVWALAATRQVPTARVLAGLIVALAGVAFVVELPTARPGDIDLPGVAFGLLTAAAVAAFSVFGGHAARASGALTANTWAFVLAGGVWLVFQAFRGVPALFHRPSLLAEACVIGLFGTLVPFLVYAWGTARIGAQAGAISISLEPLFGAVLAWSWLGQTLNEVQIAGAAVLVAAVIFLQRADRSSQIMAPKNRKRLRSGDQTSDRSAVVL